MEAGWLPCLMRTSYFHLAGLVNPRCYHASSRRTQGKKLAGIISLGMCSGSVVGYFLLSDLGLLYVLGNSIGLLVGFIGILVNLTLKKACDLAVVGALANLGMIGVFIYAVLL